jgi:hypothetical protein
MKEGTAYEHLQFCGLCCACFVTMLCGIELQHDITLTPLAKAIRLVITLSAIVNFAQRQTTMAQAEGKQPRKLKRKL